MQIESDAVIPLDGDPSTVFERLVMDRSLNATRISIVWPDKEIRFEGVGSGHSMLYLKTSVPKQSYVALATYSDVEVEALLNSFVESYEEANARVEWQSDRVTAFHIALVVFALVMGAFVVYGLFVEFF